MSSRPFSSAKRVTKRGELERKQQQLQMTLKEQNWISFVQVMLQNYRMQVGQLSTQFNKTVVRTIDNLEFIEKKVETPEPEESPAKRKEGGEEEAPPPVEPNLLAGDRGGEAQLQNLNQSKFSRGKKQHPSLTVKSGESKVC